MDILPKAIRCRLLQWSTLRQLDEETEDLKAICMETIGFVSSTLKPFMVDPAPTGLDVAIFDDLVRCLNRTIFLVRPKKRNDENTNRTVYDVMAALYSSLFDVLFVKSMGSTLDSTNCANLIGSCGYHLNGSVEYVMDSILQCEFLEDSVAVDFVKELVGKVRDMLKLEKTNPIDTKTFLKGVILYHKCGRVIGCGRKVEKSLKRVLLKRHSDGDDTVNFINQFPSISIPHGTLPPSDNRKWLATLFDGSIMTADNCSQLLWCLAGSSTLEASLTVTVTPNQLDLEPDAVLGSLNATFAAPVDEGNRNQETLDDNAEDNVKSGKDANQPNEETSSEDARNEDFLATVESSPSKSPAQRKLRSGVYHVVSPQLDIFGGQQKSPFKVTRSAKRKLSMSSDGEVEPSISDVPVLKEAVVVLEKFSNPTDKRIDPNPQLGSDASMENVGIVTRSKKMSETSQYQTNEEMPDNTDKGKSPSKSKRSDKQQALSPSKGNGSPDKQSQALSVERSESTRQLRFIDKLSPIKAIDHPSTFLRSQSAKSIGKRRSAISDKQSPASDQSTRKRKLTPSPEKETQSPGYNMRRRDPNISYKESRPIK